ncbi:CDP-Glycerol:Poly(glycerophosphate) glycerophosphotransferase [Asanoa hainanensis]|uniref:CDP-Glycerol:Poly(Glycerophosphate) glycerophosphotransferase n=1 Tax=Asanoa hainanensis TaxID=560556 RepID=A0A239PHW2_9ACTN|nr:CDP-glycerol glycerophosphotransferase family protein [Asanoa hainanensis]SNT65899.1 CDP-Glycerol:Poly(glycerophosphate) glycerophosphotransferase [Asanoa hainanensis]
MRRPNRRETADHIATLVTSALVPVGLLTPAWWLLSLLAADLLTEACRDSLGASNRAVQNRSAVARAGLRGVAALAGLAAVQSRALPVIAGFAVLVCSQLGAVGLSLLRRQLAQHRTLPFITRNIDLAELRIPAPPGQLLRLIDPGVERFGTSAIAVAVAATAATDRPAVAISTAVTVLTGETACAVALSAHVRRNKHLANRRSVIDVIRRQVESFQPRLMLYALSHPTDRIHVAMWLPVFERLPMPTIIVMRDREISYLIEEDSFELNPPSCPLLVGASFGDLRAVMPQDVAITFFPSGLMDNYLVAAHLPSSRLVLLNHGDSDKNSSASRADLLYDQVWVAGRIGRERYLRAPFHLDEDRIVEIGRPQLAGLSATTRRNWNTPFGMTVLYAPTWEAWNADNNYSSLAERGTAIIDALLAHPTELRVWFKPHPKTGFFSEQARRARDDISQRLEAANASAPPSAAPEQPHRTITDSQRMLHEYFDEVDLLITDVSGVASDFVATQRPFAMVNMTSHTNDEFRHNFPVAAGAYIIGRTANDVGDFIDACMRSYPDDPLADARRDLANSLLGSDYQDSFPRFELAANDLLNSGRMGLRDHPAHEGG